MAAVQTSNGKRSSVNIDNSTIESLQNTVDGSKSPPASGHGRRPSKRTIPRAPPRPPPRSLAGGGISASTMFPVSSRINRSTSMQLRSPAMLMAEIHQKARHMDSSELEGSATATSEDMSSNAGDTEHKQARDRFHSMAEIDPRNSVMEFMFTMRESNPPPSIDSRLSHRNRMQKLKRRSLPGLPIMISVVAISSQRTTFFQLSVPSTMTLGELQKKFAYRHPNYIYNHQHLTDENTNLSSLGISPSNPLLVFNLRDNNRTKLNASKIKVLNIQANTGYPAEVALFLLKLTRFIFTETIPPYYDYLQMYKSTDALTAHPKFQNKSRGSREIQPLPSNRPKQVLMEGSFEMDDSNGFPFFGAQKSADPNITPPDSPMDGTVPPLQLPALELSNRSSLQSLNESKTDSPQPTHNKLQPKDGNIYLDIYSPCHNQKDLNCVVRQCDTIARVKAVLRQRLAFKNEKLLLFVPTKMDLTSIRSQSVNADTYDDYTYDSDESVSLSDLTMANTMDTTSHSPADSVGDESRDPTYVAADAAATGGRSRVTSRSVCEYKPGQGAAPPPKVSTDDQLTRRSSLGAKPTKFAPSLRDNDSDDSLEYDSDGEEKSQKISPFLFDELSENTDVSANSTKSSKKKMRPFSARISLRALGGKRKSKTAMNGKPLSLDMNDIPNDELALKRKNSQSIPHRLSSLLTPRAKTLQSEGADQKNRTRSSEDTAIGMKTRDQLQQYRTEGINFIQLRDDTITMDRLPIYFPDNESGNKRYLVISGGSVQSFICQQRTFIYALPLAGNPLHMNTEEINEIKEWCLGINVKQLTASDNARWVAPGSRHNLSIQRATNIKKSSDGAMFEVRVHYQDEGGRSNSMFISEAMTVAEFTKQVAMLNSDYSAVSVDVFVFDPKLNKKYKIPLPPDQIMCQCVRPDRFQSNLEVCIVRHRTDENTQGKGSTRPKRNSFSQNHRASRAKTREAEPVKKKQSLVSKLTHLGKKKDKSDKSKKKGDKDAYLKTKRNTTGGVGVGAIERSRTPDPKSAPKTSPLKKDKYQHLGIADASKVGSTAVRSKTPSVSKRNSGSAKKPPPKTRAAAKTIPTNKRKSRSSKPAMSRSKSPTKTKSPLNARSVTRSLTPNAANRGGKSPSASSSTGGLSPISPLIGSTRKASFEKPRPPGRKKSSADEPPKRKRKAGQSDRAKQRKNAKNVANTTAADGSEDEDGRRSSVTHRSVLKPSIARRNSLKKGDINVAQLKAQNSNPKKGKKKNKK